MSLIGVEFPTFTYTVDRGKIKEFVQAIGDQNRIYVDLEVAKAEGFRDIPISPTFATAIEMWEGADFEQLISTLNLNPLKVLHGEQHYEYFADICAGDVLTGKTTCIGEAEKRGMKFITLETVLKNSDNIMVLKATSVVIERS